MRDTQPVNHTTPIVRAFKKLSALVALGAIASTLGVVAANPASAAPTNDNFANARVLTASGTLSQSSVGATDEPGEPGPIFNPAGASVWFSWVAPSTGPTTFDTMRSPVDTGLAVYTGTTLGTLTLVASDDDGNGSGCTQQSWLQFNAVQGVRYSIQIATQDDLTTTTALRLTWNGGWNGYHSNDNIANATALNGATNSHVTDTTLDATYETAIADEGPGTDIHSLWYRFVAAYDMTIDVSLTSGSGVNTFGFPYEIQADLYPATPNASNRIDWTTSGNSPASTDLVANDVVYISVNSQQICDEGQFNLTVSVTSLAAPSSPSSVIATAADGYAIVGFAAPSSPGGSPITSYTVTASPGGLTMDGISSPIIIDGLTNGVAYSFSLYATNSFGDSAPSPSSNTVTPATYSGPAFRSVPAPTIRATYIPISGDFDGNGTGDILWYRPGKSSDVLRRGTARGIFVAGQKVNISGVYQPIAGDFNGDHKTDILWYSPGAGKEALWYGSSGPAPFLSRKVRSVSAVYTPVVGDFNADGRSDILWYSPGRGREALWYGTSTSARFVSGHAPSINGAYIPIAGDFNGDRYTDIVWYAPGAAKDSFAVGSPSGFIHGPAISIRGVYAPSVGDFNGDGSQDVLLYSQNHGDTLLRGSPYGFLKGPSVAIGPGYSGVSGDFNGDGKSDMLWWSATLKEILALGL